MILQVVSLIAIFSISSASFNTNELGIPGILVEQPTLNRANSSNFKCGNQTAGPVCADDCRTLLACIGDDEPVYSHLCEQSNYDKRYCVGKVCARFPDNSNPQCNVNTFRCTSSGVFPDPYDCSQYYSCSNETDVSPSKYKCPDDFVYNSETKLCNKYAGYNCYQFSRYCIYLNNNFTSFWPNRAYYGFCGVPIVMFKCADEKNYIFDTDVNECVYGCKKSGFFVNPSNCSEYFICEYSGAKGKSQSCPSGTKFNGVECIDFESDECPDIIEATTTSWPWTTTTPRTTWPWTTTTRRTTWPWTTTTRPWTTTTRWTGTPTHTWPVTTTTRRPWSTTTPWTGTPTHTWPATTTTRRPWSTTTPWTGTPTNPWPTTTTPRTTWPTCPPCPPCDSQDSHQIIRQPPTPDTSSQRFTCWTCPTCPPSSTSIEPSTAEGTAL